MQIYIHPWISSAAFISVRRNETRPIGVHNLFRLWIVPSYVIRRWRLRAVGRYICKGQIQSDGVLDKGTWIWKRGQSGKWTIDFPCHKRARARLYSRRCRNESGLEEEEEGGTICYRFRTTVTKLTYAANDGAIFSTPVISRTVYTYPYLRKWL